MVMIAHITDLHLVEESYRRRSFYERARLTYLNTGRTIDPARRREHLLHALRMARSSDHIVLTGDLTEDGVPEQFEILADVLDEAGVDPGRVTLVAGNHDLYADPCEWQRALDGPLRPFARTSQVGRALDFGDVLMLPILTAVPRPFLGSAGAFCSAQAQQVGELASDCYAHERTLIVAQHHPPLGYRNPIWNWLDGMDDVRGFHELLRVHAHLHVLHGHTHLQQSMQLMPGRDEQIHAGAAVLDSQHNVRFYEASSAGLRILEDIEAKRPRPPAGAFAAPPAFSLGSLASWPQAEAESSA